MDLCYPIKFFFFNSTHYLWKRWHLISRDQVWTPERINPIKFLECICEQIKVANCKHHPNIEGDSFFFNIGCMETDMNNCFYPSPFLQWCFNHHNYSLGTNWINKQNSYEKTKRKEMNQNAEQSQLVARFWFNLHLNFHSLNFSKSLVFLRPLDYKVVKRGFQCISNFLKTYSPLTWSAHVFLFIF